MVLWFLYKYMMYLIKIKSYIILKWGIWRVKEWCFVCGFEIFWIDRYYGMVREREIDFLRYRDLDFWIWLLFMIWSGGWMVFFFVVMCCLWFLFGYSIVFLLCWGLNCYCKMVGNVVGVYVNGCIWFLNKFFDGFLNVFWCKFVFLC